MSVPVGPRILVFNPLWLKLCVYSLSTLYNVDALNGFPEMCSDSFRDFSGHRNKWKGQGEACYQMGSVTCQQEVVAGWLLISLCL